MILCRRWFQTAFSVSRSGVAQRVLLVDDHPGFRRMARRLLEAGGFVVVGEAATGGEALSQTLQLEPDLVLLDVLLPDTNGVAVAEQLADLDRPPMVILISSRLRSELAPMLSGARVRGFLQKDELTVKHLMDLAG
jgi:DNA-binding NarL/FixJ family response regulator